MQPISKTIAAFNTQGPGTSQSVCREKHFNYHICYENIGRKHSKILKNQETNRPWTDRTEQYARKKSVVNEIKKESTLTQGFKE